MNDNSKNNLNSYASPKDSLGGPSDGELMRLNLEKMKMQLANLKAENQRKDGEIRDLSVTVKNLIDTHSGNFPEAMSKIKTVYLRSLPVV